MQLKKLEPLEVKEKMKKGKIPEYDYTLVYVSYDYFECPVCHWFKFIKRIKKVLFE